MNKKCMQYTVTLNNRPGALAELTKIFAEKNWNMLALTCETFGDVGFARLVIDADDPAIRRILEQGGYQPKTCQVFMIDLENKPGQFHQITQMLAAEKININTVYCAGHESGMGTIIIGVDQPEKAWTFLKGELAATR